MAGGWWEVTWLNGLAIITITYFISHIMYLVVTAKAGVACQLHFTAASPFAFAIILFSVKKHSYTGPSVTSDPSVTDSLCRTTDIEIWLQIECVQLIAVSVGECRAVVESSEVDSIFRSLPAVDSVCWADAL